MVKIALRAAQSLYHAVLDLLDAIDSLHLEPSKRRRSRP